MRQGRPWTSNVNLLSRQREEIQEVLPRRARRRTLTCIAAIGELRNPSSQARYGCACERWSNDRDDAKPLARASQAVEDEALGSNRSRCRRARGHLCLAPRRPIRVPASLPGLARPSNPRKNGKKTEAATVSPICGLSSRVRASWRRRCSRRSRPARRARDASSERRSTGRR